MPACLYKRRTRDFLSFDVLINIIASTSAHCAIVGSLGRLTSTTTPSCFEDRTDFSLRQLPFLLSHFPLLFLLLSILSLLLCSLDTVRVWLSLGCCDLKATTSDRPVVRLSDSKCLVKHSLSRLLPPPDDEDEVKQKQQH